MNNLSDLMYVHDSVNSCIPQLREIISEASGVKLDYIRNGLSIRGADLTKQTSNKMLVSIKPEDSFIVFILKTTSDTDITASEPNGSISNVISLELSLNIYGNDCLDRQQRLKTMLRSRTYRDKLDEYGFVLRKIDNGQLFTEAINQIYYLRVDTTLNLDTVISYSNDGSSVNCKCDR